MVNPGTRYWQKNKRYLLILLIVWFIVSYGFGILFAPVLDHIRIGGFKWGSGLPSKGLYMFLWPLSLCMST